MHYVVGVLVEHPMIPTNTQDTNTLSPPTAELPHNSQEVPMLNLFYMFLGENEQTHD